MQKAIPVMISLCSLFGRKWSIIARIIRTEIVENDKYSGSVNHVFEEGCLLAQAFDGLFVLLDGDLHVPDYAAVAFLLLDESFLHAGQDLCQSFVPLL